MRVDGWEIRLFETIERYRDTPFSWQDSHCLHMAKDVVTALRGDDFETPAIPSCKDAADAKRLMKASKATSSADLYERLFERINPVQAQRGDIGVVGPATVVCVGKDWFGRTEQGPLIVGVELVETAFRV